MNQATCSCSLSALKSDQASAEQGCCCRQPPWSHDELLHCHAGNDAAVDLLSSSEDEVAAQEEAALCAPESPCQAAAGAASRGLPPSAAPVSRSRKPAAGPAEEGLSHRIESRFQQLDLTVADEALEQPEQAAASQPQSLAEPVRRSPRKRNRWAAWLHQKFEYCLASAHELQSSPAPAEQGCTVHVIWEPHPCCCTCRPVRHPAADALKACAGGPQDSPSPMPLRRRLQSRLTAPEPADDQETIILD